MDLVIDFSGRLWEAEAEAPWVFVTLPGERADDVRARVPGGPGFGSVKVLARIGRSEWRTSIFPDKKSGSYVLPVKRSIRTAEGIATGETVTVTLRLVE